MDHTNRDATARNFRGRHFRRSQRDDFPGLDMDGQTLDEIRRKVRGGEQEYKDGDMEGSQHE